MRKLKLFYCTNTANNGYLYSTHSPFDSFYMSSFWPNLNFLLISTWFLFVYISFSLSVDPRSLNELESLLNTLYRLMSLQHCRCLDTQMAYDDEKDTTFDSSTNTGNSCIVNPTSINATKSNGHFKSTMMMSHMI